MTASYTTNVTVPVTASFTLWSGSVRPVAVDWTLYVNFPAGGTAARIQFTADGTNPIAEFPMQGGTAGAASLGDGHNIVVPSNAIGWRVFDGTTAGRLVCLRWWLQ